MKLNKYVRKNLVNMPGWRTNRKIIVIESDDWGSIRMPSREVYELLLSKGIAVDKHYFLKNDCLESNDDLEALFEVLRLFKDKNGNYPVITANAVVANPDFRKITASGLTEYHYELITETYKSYPNHDRVMNLWKDHGIGEKMLWPQYHGREHLNAKKWLRAINSGREQERVAFEQKVLFGFGSKEDQNRRFNYMAAFEYENEKDKLYIEQMTIDGLEHFNNIFGFNSKSFVASCSIRGDHIDSVLAGNGVKFHQCGQQFVPTKNGKLKMINKFWGSQNEEGLIYWRRNATFEPSRDQHYDWVNSCLNEIKLAFRWHKPATINSHRVNYIGSIFPENRERSLDKLHDLLKRIIQKWPDVEFLSSDVMGNLIKK